MKISNVGSDMLICTTIDIPSILIMKRIGMSHHGCQLLWWVSPLVVIIIPMKAVKRHVVLLPTYLTSIRIKIWITCPCKYTCRIGRCMLGGGRDKIPIAIAMNFFLN